MRAPLTEVLQSDRLLVCDGAMGTELYRRGIFLNQSFEGLNLHQPKLVSAVHEAYVQAGAEVIATNTFACHRFKLAAHGLDSNTSELAYKGARLARKAAGDGVYVLGSLGPLGIRIEPFGPTSLEEACKVFQEPMRALLDGGVDGILLETFSDLQEIKVAIEAVRALRADLPVIAHMTIGVDGLSPQGTPPAVIAQRLSQWGATVVGLNCSVGPGPILEAVEKMVEVTERPISVQPNAGRPKEVDGRMLYLCSPEYMALYAKRFYRLGVRLVGGCCGTSPEHIKAIREVAGTLSGPRVSFFHGSAVPASPEVEPVAAAEKSRLGKALAEGRFVHAQQIIPPRGASAAKTVQRARMLAEAGVEWLMVGEPSAHSNRMANIPLAALLERETGVETAVIYSCRETPLSRMQAELFGAHALGLRNVVGVTGDPSGMSRPADQIGVQDVDAIGMTNLVRKLNRAEDLGGNAMRAPTRWLVGVGLDMSPADRKRELRRFFWKMDAGAEYALSYPVFDAEAAQRFLDKLRPEIPIILTVVPLTSARLAEQMHNEIPGLSVPATLRKRLAGAEPQDAAAIGVEAALKLVEDLRPRVAGVCVSPHSGSNELALEMVRGVEALIG